MSRLRERGIYRIQLYRSRADPVSGVLARPAGTLTLPVAGRGPSQRRTGIGPRFHARIDGLRSGSGGSSPFYTALPYRYELFRAESTGHDLEVRDTCRARCRPSATTIGPATERSEHERLGNDPAIRIKLSLRKLDVDAVVTFRLVTRRLRWEFASPSVSPPRPPDRHSTVGRRR